MLLASNFDNTLFVPDINIVNKNIKSIHNFRNKGNIFAIITGRGNSIRKYIKEYNILYDYLICENGAMIFDSNNNIISSTYLEEKDISKIIDIIKREKLSYILDTGLEYITDMNITANKLVCIYLDKNKISNPQKLLKEILEKANTYSDISDNYINIVNKKINKTIALEKLSNYLNNPKIYTIGDKINDISMITKYNGGIMKIHKKELNSLPNKKYDSLSEYVEELI